MKLHNVLLLFGAVFMLGCMKEVESQLDKQIKADDELVKNYITTNQLNLERDASGLYFKPLQTNPSGKALAAKDIVSLKYKISRLDGHVLEETQQARLAMHYAQPSVRTMYSNAISPVGIDLGLGHMKEGEKYQFIVPSYLGFYNLSIKDTLPAYSNLIAEVEVVDVLTAGEQKAMENEAIETFIEEQEWENVDRLNSGVRYVQTQEGEGDRAAKADVVKVHYTGRLLDGQEFDASDTSKAPFQFTLGTGAVIQGWDEGIALMKKGEKGILIIPSDLAYGHTVFTLPSYMSDFAIPPFSTLVFEIEIVDIL
jgi:FKBP-type peptidyl-prolyl cis-trans isomerase